jgi:hypothetical protein
MLGDDAGADTGVLGQKLPPLKAKIRTTRGKKYAKSADSDTESPSTAAVSKGQNAFLQKSIEMKALDILISKGSKNAVALSEARLMEIAGLSTTVPHYYPPRHDAITTRRVTNSLNKEETSDSEEEEDESPSHDFSTPQVFIKSFKTFCTN